MWLAISLFDLDGLDFLVEETTPWLGLALFALAIVLAIVVVRNCADRIVHRSPVDKLLRRRFG